jgi:hypothetical protein
MCNNNSLHPTSNINFNKEQNQILFPTIGDFETKKTPNSGTVCSVNVTLKIGEQLLLVSKFQVQSIKYINPNLFPLYNE